MSSISDLEIVELQKALTMKQAAHNILDNFLPMLYNSYKADTIPHPDAYSRDKDPITVDLLPEEIKTWKPVKATPNGNCLFHSVSILLVGNETLAGILRLLTVAELFAHSDFYAAHPQIPKMAQASGYSEKAIFNIFLSDQSASDAYAGDPDKASRAIEVLAQVTVKPFVFASQFHILALASVICKPINSTYPNIPRKTAIRNSVHGLFYPRQSFSDGNESLQAADPIHVMWTHTQCIPLHNWSPNHFAPLVRTPSQESQVSGTKISYADVVKRTRKRLQHFV